MNKECVEYWLHRYEAQDFVRWSIQDKESKSLIGTVEVCPSLKYAVDGKMMGILRIDLKSEYEKQAVLEELMDILMVHIYEDFQVAYQFVSAKEECNIGFSDYYVSYR